MNRWWMRVLAFSRPELPGLALLFLLSILKIGVDVLRPWPMTFIIDCVLKGAPLPGTVGLLIPAGTGRKGLLLVFTLATVLVFLAAWTIQIAENYLRTGTASRIRFGLASAVFDHLQRLSLRFHGRRPTGDLLKRITADTACARILIMDVALPVFTSVGSLLAMFAVMWRIDPVLAVVAIGAAPLQAAVIRQLAGPMEEASYTYAEAQGESLALAEQSLAALPAVRAFGREEKESGAFRHLCQCADRAYLRSIWTQVKFRLGVEAVSAIGTAGVLFLGGWHVLEGRISVGSLLVFTSYLISLYDPIETLAYMSVSFATASAGARRVFDVLDSNEKLIEIPGAKPILQVRGRIRFENVSCGYQQDRPVLKNISFDVKPGELIAIVGRTGAGKTTLVSLIPRLLDPFAGRVVLDDTPLSEIQLNSLRKQVSVVLQDPFLLPLSIAENIAYGKPSATRAEIEAAAKAAMADEFVLRLPDGYDTVIGQRGATLSGGERQRIAIARALLKDAPVLILDEPTAQLDAETEAALLTALDRLIQNRTTFVIAHRLSTVRKAHRIFVVDSGELAEVGTHVELMSQDGLYAKVHGRQFSEPAAE